MDDSRDKLSPEISRRRFLQLAGAYSFAVAAGVDLLVPGELLAMPTSEGYLLVDLKKCQGCGTCMMACAIAHSGVASYTLARIQIQQDSFGVWPDDVYMVACRQCEDAPCVDACPVTPVKANRVRPEFGNVRMIDQKLCIGCKSCIENCPFTPVRVQWDFSIRKSQKCDLCVDTPHLGEKGGPGGIQTCTKVCPVNAISVTKIMPDQSRVDSYYVNLRGPAWAKLGMTTK